jgi:DNA processing protein
MQSSDLVISEFGFGTPPLKHHFPQRNRIISGLSWAVVVVEARSQSGALITARYALDENRLVFAVPHPLFTTGGVGCNQLIRQGAVPLLEARDVLTELAPIVGFDLQSAEKINKDSDSRAHEAIEMAQDSAERLVYAKLAQSPACSVDQLVAAGCGDCREVLQSLSQLEIKDQVERGYDGRYGLKVVHT